MKRAAATGIVLAVSLLLGVSGVGDADASTTGAEIEIMDTLDALSDAELDALVAQHEEMEQLQNETSLRFNEVYRDYLVGVVEAASASGELEHEVAALLLAGNYGVRGHEFEPGVLDGLMRRSMAGAALRPDLLSALDVACGLLASAWTPEDPGARRAPPQGCDDSGTRRRLTAIEPANAYHWIRRLDSDLRAGDRETARAHLLATGRSTSWRPPFRTILGLLRETLTRWPPSQELTEAARAFSESMAEAHLLSAADVAYFEAPLDPGSLVAQTVLGLILALPFGPYQPTLELCREAVAATDRAVLVACQRLARMMVDAGDTLVDVMVGYSLLIETGSPSEAARAETERDALRKNLIEAYTSALTEHAITQDILVDVANWIEHGEIEMMRRGLARVQAELASRASIEGAVEDE